MFCTVVLEGAGRFSIMSSTMKALKRCALPLLALVLSAGCVSGPRGFPQVGGIANLDQVNPHLYRGAQPNRLGLQYLHEHGVRTIINLRMPDDTWAPEAGTARELGMDYFHVPFGRWQSPATGRVNEVLKIIKESDGPVFVHCERGCDRTGVVIACYRIRYDGWSSAKALQEAQMYGMYSWELFMKRFVKEFERSAKASSK